MSGASVTDYVQKAFAAASQRSWPEAEAACRQALAEQPDHADALHLMALTLKLSGRLMESLPYYEKILALYPTAEFLPTILGNYGNALREAKAFDRAEAVYRKIIAMKPYAFDAYGSLGLVLQDMGRFNDAKQFYLKALSLNPDYADGWNNLGGVHQKHGELNEAMRAYKKAIELRPQFPQAHYNLGNVLSDGGLLLDAVNHYRISLEQDPDYVEAAISWLRQAQNMCRWDEVTKLSEQLRERVNVRRDGRVFPFAFIGIETSAKEQFDCGKQWAEHRYLPLAAKYKAPDFSSRRSKTGRIKLGYLSSDFHNHATAYLMAELVELHNREQFELFAYSAGADDGKEMRKRLVVAFDHFVDIQHFSFEQAAHRILADEIDILVDLKGYTRDTRAAILAFRPAPVIVSYLGYPGTLGAPLCDYVISDTYVTPPEYFGDFCEKVIQLPCCYQPNDRHRKIGEPVTREEAGLPPKAFVFACFNHTYKITPEVFLIWMRLLGEVGDSVLWLLKSNAWAEENLKRAAVGHGVAPERILFAPEKPLADHLARARCADLFLDTLPVNAHTTASDALWVGLPIVALSGATFISRVSGSLLHACGLDDLIAIDHDDYLQKALSLASDRLRLAEVKKYLQNYRNFHPLFETEMYSKELEKAYVCMWNEFENKRDSEPDEKGVLRDTFFLASTPPQVVVVHDSPLEGRSIAVNNGGGAVMIRRPIVSIIIPAYGRPEKLSRALASVPSAVSLSHEIIVVDDCAEGSGFSAALEAGAKYFNKGGCDRGVSISRNRGLDLAQGEWVVFLDDDDYFENNGIDNLLNAASNGCVLVYGNHTLFKHGSQVAVGLEQVTLDAMLVTNHIPIGAYAVRRTAIKHRFDEKMDSHEDWDFLLGIFAEEAVRHVPSNIVYVDKTENSTTSLSARRRAYFWSDYLSVYIRYPAPHLAAERAAMIARMGLSIPASLLGNGH